MGNLINLREFEGKKVSLTYCGDLNNDNNLTTKRAVEMFTMEGFLISVSLYRSILKLETGKRVMLDNEDIESVSLL